MTTAAITEAPITCLTIEMLLVRMFGSYTLANAQQRLCPRLRQRERNEPRCRPRRLLSMDREDDVLLAAMHVGHRHARLRLRNVRFPDDIASLLVVGTELRLTLVAFAGKQQRLRDEEARARGASRSR